eukprot:391499_1
MTRKIRSHSVDVGLNTYSPSPVSSSDSVSLYAPVIRNSPIPVAVRSFNVTCPRSPRRKPSTPPPLARQPPTLALGGCGRRNNVCADNVATDYSGDDYSISPNPVARSLRDHLQDAIIMNVNHLADEMTSLDVDPSSVPPFTVQRTCLGVLSTSGGSPFSDNAAAYKHHVADYQDPPIGGHISRRHKSSSAASSCSIPIHARVYDSRFEQSPTTFGRDSPSTASPSYSLNTSWSSMDQQFVGCEDSEMVFQLD